MEQLPSTLSFPPGLSVEVAVNEVAAQTGSPIADDTELAKQFDLTVEQLEKIKLNPVFRAEVREHVKTVKEGAVSVKRKAQIACEYYLHEFVPSAMADPSVSPDTKLKILQFLAKIGALEPTEKSAAQLAAEAVSASRQNIGINLIFPQGTQTPTIVSSPTVLEQV